MQSPPFLRYLVPPRSKYSPQHHVLKQPQLQNVYYTSLTLLRQKWSYITSIHFVTYSVFRAERPIVVYCESWGNNRIHCADKCSSLVLSMVVSNLTTRLLSINSERVMTREINEPFLTKFKVLSFTVGSTQDSHETSIQETGPSSQVHSDVPLCTT